MQPIPEALQRLPLIGKMSRSLWRAYAERRALRYSVESRGGLLFLLDDRAAVDRHMLVRGGWENQQIATLSNLARKAVESGRRMVFLDVGSHAALYAMIMARTGMFDEIVALEPDPVNLAQLHANLFLNSMVGAMKVLDVAASDAAGEAVFHVAVDTFRAGSRIDAEGEIGLSHQITVKTARLDDLIAASGATIVAKIDVEGHELKVLKGMELLLARNRVILQIESSTPAKLQAVTDHLAPFGINRVSSLRDDHYFVHDGLGSAA
jgi:FkbM family methyltransferase